METLLIKYGYVLFFLGIAAEGDAVLLAGALMSHRGVFSLPLVIFLAVTSSTLANTIYYMMARVRGRAWLINRFGSRESLRKVVHWMERHSGWLLLANRYAIGFRIIIPAACGALGMKPARFHALNLMANILWAVPTALLAFYFADAAEAFFREAKRYELWILALLVLASAAILLYRHLRHVEWFEDFRIEDLHYLAPLLIGFMGAVNLLSAIWPRSPGQFRALGEWFPLAAAQPSRPLMLLAGVALLQVSHSLALRKKLAWYVAVLALSASLLLHLTRDFDLQHALAAALLLAYLLPNRRLYDAPSGTGSIRVAVLTSCLIAAAVFAYGYIGLWHLEEQFVWRDAPDPGAETVRSGFLILEPGLHAKTARAQRFLNSLQIAGWLARIYIMVLFLPPVIFRRRRRSAQ